MPAICPLLKSLSMSRGFESEYGGSVSARASSAVQRVTDVDDLPLHETLTAQKRVADVCTAEHVEECLIVSGQVTEIWIPHCSGRDINAALEDVRGPIGAA